MINLYTDVKTVFCNNRKKSQFLREEKGNKNEKYSILAIILQDLRKAYNVMLGAPKWQQLEYMPCQGLFGERKQTKFFQVSL